MKKGCSFAARYNERLWELKAAMLRSLNHY